MPRWSIFILLLVTLLAPIGLRALIESQPASNAADADTLVIVTPHNSDIRNAFAEAFVQWHRRHYPDFGRPVAIDYRTFGGTNDIKRLLDTTYRPYRDARGKLPDPSAINPEIDVAWGGGDFFFDKQLKPLGLLQPMDIDPSLLTACFPKPKLAGVELYDYTLGPDGKPLPPTWVGVCLSEFGIVYNPDLYNHLGLPYPAQWHDLTDPALSGLVALADPTHSGSASVTYMMVIQRAMADAEGDYFKSHPAVAKLPPAAWTKDAGYNAAIAAGWKKGMAILLKIAANARYFTDSSTLPPTDVGNGNAAAGLAIDFYGRVEEEIAGPSRAVYITPKAATAIGPDPVAILYAVKGEKRTLAEHFIEFLLSPEGQRLWDLKAGVPGGPRLRALHRPPIRPDVYADRTNWADPTLNPYNDAGNFNQRAAWMALMADTVPIWGAAWIDNHDALVSAYRAVLAVPDATRRAALLDQLADFPVTMADVGAQHEAHNKIQNTTEVDIWSARTHVEWLKKFAAHYRRIEQAAKGAS
jgi:iron(III) transport system substrate-binding protein